MQAATTHLARYPMHYGVLALFLLAVVLIPQVREDGAQLPFASATPLTGIGSPAQAATAAGETTPATGGTPIAAPTFSGALAPAGGPLPSAAGGALDDLEGDSVSTTPTPPTAPPTPAPPRGPEADDGVELPSLPPTPLPPAPEEIEPVLDAVGPLADTGCSGIGLAGVVLAIVGPSAPQEVPVGDLLPYVAPAYMACAYFPPPSDQPLICDIDEQMRATGYPADVSGLAKTPNLIGMGVEVLYGIEAAIESYTGTNPGMVDSIAAQLGCHPDAG